MSDYPERYYNAIQIVDAVSSVVRHRTTMKILQNLADKKTCDVVPMKHGKWILDEDPHDGDCRCSACWVCIDQMHERNHRLLNAITGNKWWTFYKFCPNCGARMDT